MPPAGPLGVSIRDLRDPVTLPVLGNIAVGESRLVAVSGHRAYVATADGGLHIVDVTDARQPFEIGMLHVVNTEQASDLVVDDHMVYLVGGGALNLIDVSDPTNPRLVQRLRPPTEALAVAVADGRAYTVGPFGGLAVFGVSDPQAVREIGHLVGSGPSISRIAIAVAGPHVFAGHGPSELRVADVSDPAAPRFVDTLVLPAALQALAIDGEHLYVGAGTAGLLVLHVKGLPIPTATPLASATSPTTATATVTPSPTPTVTVTSTATSSSTTAPTATSTITPSATVVETTDVPDRGRVFLPLVSVGRLPWTNDQARAQWAATMT